VRGVIGYAITSRAAIQASPAELAAIARGHWLIEDQLHWGPRHGLGRGPLIGPQRQRPPRDGRLGNLAITVVRLTGETSIAVALRYHARQPGRPGQAILNC
jgi:hypothetical protein